MITVLVTQPQYDKVREVFEHAEGFQCFPAPESEPELARLVRKKHAKYVIVGGAPYRNELYDAVPKGGVIARFGVGCDNIDLPRAAEKGHLLHQHARRTRTIRRGVRHRHDPAGGASIHRRGRRLPQRALAAQTGCELAGKTLAVIGCGAIGSRVAAIAKNGFGMSVTGVIRSAPRPDCPADRFVKNWSDADGRRRFRLPPHPRLPGKPQLRFRRAAETNETRFLADQHRPGQRGRRSRAL